MTTYLPGDTYFNQSGATNIGGYASSPPPDVPEDFWSSGSSSGAEAIGKTAFDPYGIGQEASKESSDERDKKRRQALELARTQQEQRGGQQSQVSGGNASSIQGSFGTGTQIVTPGVTVTGGSSGSGLGSTLGQIAGIGLSMIPGVGPAARAALPALGSSIGGLFG